MKRTALFSLLILGLTIILPACHEDVYMDWKIKNQQWLINNKASDSKIIETASGLQYKVIQQGWEFSRKPNKNSTVIVSYTGTLIDGSVFGSGIVDTLSLGNTIKGWQEGIPKMNGGGTYKFYIPSSLAYDTVSTNFKIPPYSTLIYTVELIDSQY